ncbi:uncharacterized protein LOC144611936 isoform X1 [Rhinoraja longicauda]
MALTRFLLKVLDELSADDLKRFTFFLGNSAEEEAIPRGRLEGKTCEDIAILLQKHYGQQAWDVTRKILLDVPRRDLVEKMFAGGEVDWARGGSQERKRVGLPGQDCAGTVSDQLQSDKPTPKKSREIAKTLTDKQLMKLASQMGDNWMPIGIQFLNLKSYEIQRCESQSSHVMKIFTMLEMWRDRKKKEATAKQLHSILASRDCPISSECIDWLHEENE